MLNFFKIFSNKHKLFIIHLYKKYSTLLGLLFYIGIFWLLDHLSKFIPYYVKKYITDSASKNILFLSAVLILIAIFIFLIFILVNFIINSYTTSKQKTINDPFYVFWHIIIRCYLGIFVAIIFITILTVVILFFGDFLILKYAYIYYSAIVDSIKGTNGKNPLTDFEQIQTLGMIVNHLTEYVLIILTLISILSVGYITYKKFSNHNK